MEKLRRFFEGQDKERLGSLIVIFLIGVLLITVISNPFTKEKDSSKPFVEEVTTNVTSDSYAKDLENRLSSILSKVDGAGEVSVMVTISTGAEIVLSNSLEEEYDSEEEVSDALTKKTSSTSKKLEPLILKEAPIILTEKAPTVEGVIIVAEGGENVHVKDGLIRSVTSALGIPSHKVQVLKGTSKNLELLK